MPPSPPKVALVTGAARGIGLAVVKRFLTEGWRVALLDIEGALLHGAVAVLACPDSTMALHCDVSDAEAVADAVASVAPGLASATTAPCSNSPSMSSSATRQPSARKRFAVASPMPRAAPVINATFCGEGAMVLSVVQLISTLPLA